MRSLACLTAVLAALCLSACGGEGTTTSTTTQSDSHGFQGGEESIEGFGSEAKGADREAILSAEQEYLTALAAGDDAKACSYLSATVKRSMRQFAAELKAEGCPEFLPLLLSPQAPATARDQARGEVTKVRYEGDRAFVVFHAPGAKLYMLAMVGEGGEWKASTVAPSVLVPAVGG